MRALLWVIVIASALIAVASFVVIAYFLGQPVAVK